MPNVSFILFLTDDKQKTEGVPDGSNAVVILSSAFIRYYALDCCTDFGAGWANIHAQLVTVGCSMFLKCWTQLHGPIYAKVITLVYYPI